MIFTIYRINIDFDNVEGFPPQQTITLIKEQVEKRVSLEVSKFRNIKSLQIFIKDNYGNDITILKNLKIIGSVNR